MKSIPNNPDFVKEKVKLETELFKQFSTLFLLVASGTTTILVKALASGQWLDYILVANGALLSGALINLLRNRYKLIVRLVEDLNKN